VACVVLTFFSPKPHAHGPLHDSTTIFNSAEIQQHIDRRHILPKRKVHDAKRQRIEIYSDLHVEEREDAILTRHQSAWDLEDREVKAEKEERMYRKSDLSPCHICRRKPTAKNELDAFADCEGCGERTCWICIRECAGLGIVGEEMGIELESGQFSFEFEVERGKDERVGVENGLANGRQREEEGMIREHKRMICSRCCVERGTEGEVWCLGCLMAEGRG
jgi:hypothetical protein